MPTLTRSISSFTLKSTWSYKSKVWNEEDQKYDYFNAGTPSTTTKTVSVDLSSIPAGSRAISATLKIKTSNGSSNAKAAGKTVGVTNDHTSGINVLSWFSSIGSAISIVFSFQYSGSIPTWSSSSSGSRSSYFSDIQLIIEYELPASSGSVDVSTIEAGPDSTISVTISPSNPNYSHVVTWQLGNATETDVLDVGETVSEFDIPMSLCNQIPNATSGEGTVTIETYNGETLMGSNSYPFTVTVPETVVPTAGTMTATPVTSGIDQSLANTFIQGYSSANISLSNVSGAYGSTITSVVFSGWGATANGTASGTTYTASTPTLTMSGNVTLTAVVTDSRGRTVTKTITINIAEYTKPVISSIIAKRCLQNGTLNDQGRYASVTVVFSIASVNNLNEATTASYYKTSTSSTYIDANTPFTSGTAIVIGNQLLGTDASHNIKVTVTDKVGNTATAITSIPTTTYVMHFRDGGLSVGIGRAAVEEDNIVAINDTWRLRAYSGLLQPHSVMVGTIPSGADLNSYTVAGGYSVESNAIAASLLNRPCDLAGKLIVGSAAKDEVSVTIAASTDCYMYQMYMAYDLSGIYMRRMYTGSSSGVPSFTAWKRLMYSTDDLSTTSFTGALPISNGGTGQTTIEGVRTALNVSQDIKAGDVIDISGYKAAGWVTNSRGQFRSSICLGRRITATAVAIAGTGWIIGPGGKVIGGDSAANITTMGTFTYSIKSDAGFIGFVFSKSFSTTNNTPHTLEIATGTLTFS